jgi:O-succinylbenzoate synthase
MIGVCCRRIETVNCAAEDGGRRSTLVSALPHRLLSGIKSQLGLLSSWVGQTSSSSLAIVQLSNIVSFLLPQTIPGILDTEPDLVRYKS